MGESSKYNFSIPDNPGGTHGLVLSHVDRGDFVLECGCASGYMTEYMKKKLDCTVHVVEIDEECCERAKQWATDWYCGDLNKDEWKRYYQINACAYDKILFADVLEHLTDPLRTLKNAVSLLRKDGKVVISIPNICHNDILIRMYYDCWQYRSLGLLDNTHIHFWGVSNIEPFLNDAGLRIESIEAVAIKTQETEQRLPFHVDEELLNLLKKRPYGEVYQWVIVGGKV